MRQKMSLIIENEIEVLELFLIKILNFKSKVPVLTQTVFQPFSGLLNQGLIYFKSIKRITFRFFFGLYIFDKRKNIKIILVFKKNDL